MTTSTIPMTTGTALLSNEALSSPPHRQTKSGAPSFIGQDNLKIETSNFEQKLKKISQNVYADTFSHSNRHESNNS